VKNIFNNYKKTINPPYGTNDFFVLGATFLVLLVAFIAVISLPVQFTGQNGYKGESHAAGEFLVSFNGAPTAPQQIYSHPDLNNIGISMMMTGPEGGFQMAEPMDAQHSATCGGPPAVHTISNYDDAVFICANHVMTAITCGTGQATLSLTPAAILDWSNG
jgi:hypothetical protein